MSTTVPRPLTKTRLTYLAFTVEVEEAFAVAADDSGAAREAVDETFDEAEADGPVWSDDVIGNDEEDRVDGAESAAEVVLLAEAVEEGRDMTVTRLMPMKGCRQKEEEECLEV